MAREFLIVKTISTIIGAMLITTGITVICFSYYLKKFKEPIKLYTEAITAIKMFENLLLITGLLIIINSIINIIGVLKKFVVIVNLGILVSGTEVVFELLFMAFLLIKKNSYLQSFEQTFRNYMKTYDDNYNQRFIDYTQNQFQCCGYYNYTEWSEIGHEIVPESCLDNETGCLIEIQKFVSSLQSVFLGVTSMIVIIQVLNMVLMCLIAKSIRLTKTNILVQNQVNVEYNKRNGVTLNTGDKSQ